MKTVRFKTLECTQNDKTFFVSILPNDVLRSICFVSRRDEDPEKGFQRTLNETRAKDIARYLDELKGTIPSALILSAQDNARFAYDSNKGELSFVTNSNSFMVLDGQHRLYGLIKATKNYSIPVIIFNKLNTAQEVNLFIDINTTQKGVPTTLLLVIKISQVEKPKKRIVKDNYLIN